MDIGKGTPELSRRDFLVRSALISVAASGGVATFLGGRGLGSPLAANAMDAGIDPSLPVAGVAAFGRGAIAVGGHDAAPMVWTRAGSAGGWTQSASTSAFPAGTALLGLTATTDLAVAVGTIVHHTIDDDGTTGDHHLSPAVFTSTDGVTWSVALDGVIVSEGALTVAAADDDGFLALGYPVTDPEGIGAPGMIAVASRDGRRWTTASLDGVAAPRHGAPTLLAGDGGRMLLSIHDVGGPALYEGSIATTWRQVTGPAVPGDIVYVAAAPADNGWLLAGIDGPYSARYWKGRGGGWRSADGIGAGDDWQVSDIARTDDGLLVGGAGRAGYRHRAGRSMMAGCGDNTTKNTIDDPVDFDEIDGVGFFYGSNPDTANKVTLKADRPFKHRLNDWVADLKGFSSGYGSRGALQKVGTAGLYNPNTIRCHAVGQALDLWWVQWGLGKGATFCKPVAGAHEGKTQTIRRLYLAVDAVTRMTFKYTLDGWYSGHADHIHMDMHADPILDRGSVSDTLFVQAVCNRFNGSSLKIDGSWGPATTDAWKAINRKWGYKDDDAILGDCHPTNNALHYRAWLALVARHGFADKPAGTYQSGTC